MPPRRRIDPVPGRAALDAWLATTTESPSNTGADTGTYAGTDSDADRSATALAVRFTLEELAARHPGRTLEVRVPPFGAVQCVEGPVHRRGTPPNVIETDADTWLRLAAGLMSWQEARELATVSASGERAELGGIVPLFTP